MLLFTGPVLVLLLALIGSSVKDITQRRFQELSWMSAYFLDMLQGLATLKMFGRSREKIETIRQVSARYGSTTLEVLRTAFQTALVLEWGSTIATALVAVEIGLRLMNGGLLLRARAGRADHHAGVLSAAAPTGDSLSRGHGGQGGGRSDFCDSGYAGAARCTRPSSAATLDPPGAGACTHPDRTSASIRSRSLTTTGSVPRCKTSRCTSRTGRRVALVGATGAGKTTVANLLLRFIEPDSGSITIGGVPLNEIDLAAWRSQVAWVPQQPHLFHGTIADNIRLARPTATHDEVIAAAHGRACA